MNQEQIALLIIKGAISELDPVDQANVERVAKELNAIIEENGEAGVLAFTLVAAQKAAAL